MKTGITLVEVLIVVSIIGIFAAIIIHFCVKQQAENTPESIKKQIAVSTTVYTGDIKKELTECTYEGCQYIFVNMGNQSWGSHKGNCNNKIHMQ